MPKIDAKTRKKMVDWKINQAKYNAEFDKLKNGLPDQEDRERYDRLYRSIYLRIRAGSDGVNKLFTVSERLRDPELRELWSDLADAINNAYSIVQSKNTLMKYFHGAGK